MFNNLHNYPIPIFKGVVMERKLAREYIRHLFKKGGKASLEKFLVRLLVWVYEINQCLDYLDQNPNLLHFPGERRKGQQERAADVISLKSYRKAQSDS